MSTRYSGKSVLVTGAGSGIGAASAIAFAKEGARVAVADLDGAAARATARAIEAESGVALALTVDVADEDQITLMVETTVQNFGSLDVAFNNAGISGRQVLTADITAEDLDQVITVNLRGVLLCMRAEIVAMRRSGGGSIVNTASVAGVVGCPSAAHYSASKHGVVGLTRSAAIDHIREGIRINAICPGATDTAMLQGIMSIAPPELVKALHSSPAGRLAHPDEIARCVLFLASEDASFVVGHALIADGGETAR